MLDKMTAQLPTIGIALLGALAGSAVARLALPPGWNELGSFGDFLSAMVGIAGTALLLRQLKMSTKELHEDRVSDTLRLVTEWLESPDARKQREALYTDPFILREVPAAGQPLKAFRRKRENDADNEKVQGWVEAVVAQFDRVGAYLQLESTALAARAAVFSTYAMAVARAWLIVGPYYAEKLVRGRGRRYGAHACWLAGEALNYLEKNGHTELSLHPWGLPAKSLRATFEEARQPFEDLARLDAATTLAAKAMGKST
jgi:hypothetical protein